MGSYQEALAGLNDAQALAVTTIDGPVLVIAGPGTGKTQLLTTRIAHILSTTDTLPENILCLTFTESAAQNMRQRLSNMIGQAAYSITISTYHAFGSDLIRRFPDHFADMGELTAADDLTLDAILREIIAQLPYGNPLKFADMFMGDVKSFVSDAKRALLTPQDIRDIAAANMAFIAAAQPVVGTHLADVVRIDKKSVIHFENLEAALQDVSADVEPPTFIKPLQSTLLAELHQALLDVNDSGKTTALTKWKNAWLAKDNEGHFVIDGASTNQKIIASADVYEQYLQELSARQLFDYDDMILRAVRGLQTNDDLRFTLQEQYLYILLDEFQDTNGAQLKLVDLLTDNPVLEGRPNVLAVGDDDQAIYAFQGADYSHMLQFQRMYRDVLLVPLTKNYRSHRDVLYVARGVAEQIEERLHHHFPQIEKILEAANPSLPQKAIIERREAKSDMMQFAWTAKKIQQLIADGMPADQIAVLAPQHKYLEPLVPYLQEAGVPVRYEKRENVLDDPTINQLLRMSELATALHAKEFARANALWAEVLSFDFWQLPTSLIWKLSWQANDDEQDWTETLLEFPELKHIALFFMRLSMQVETDTLETILDYLIGVAPLDLQEADHSTFTSPFYQHNFTESLIQPDADEPVQLRVLPDDPPHMRPRQDTAAGGNGAPSHPSPANSATAPITPESVGSFWDLLTNLTVLRARLREYKAGAHEPLVLSDFIGFVEAHRAANIKVLNTSPYQDADTAVQLMTAYKAKGMEFGAVFVLAVNDEAWGTSARSQGSRLSLPPNLRFMRYGGATNDERLRLFYVAITRAKTQLYLVNYTHTFTGKALNRLRYLDEVSDVGQGSSRLLPAPSQAILPAEDTTITPTTELGMYWQYRHERAFTQEDVQALLRSRLDQFQLSPTHVNAFIDLEHAGPAYFFMNTLLRFPKAPTANGQFGNAIHETLEWLHIQNKQTDTVPNLHATLAVFEKRLRAKRLSEQDTLLMLERGKQALQAYLAQRLHTFSATNESEYNFRREGVFIGKAHMAGKIDKLIIDKQARTITIVDYKTGKSHSRWDSSVKLHKYRQQLYLYKALVEGSRKFSGYTVTDAYLEFVEPNDAGEITELHLHFDDDEYKQVRKLAEVVWQHIQQIDLPDVSSYDPTMKGVALFEHYLLANE